MDIIATQVYENCDAVSSQISHSTQDNKIQIGELIVGTEIYPIKKGINQIGRHPDCNIIFNNPTVSKRHAEIEANNHETAVWICDLNSSNKTKLNNSILRPNRFYELKNGNVLEFGMVRAVFKFYHSMDESLIPETPALSRQKLQKLIIPGTPDSSLNNSSTLGENISMISAIQTNEKETIFRCPNPISTRTSTSSTRKSDLQNSSVNNLDNSQNSDAEKKGNVGVSRINIYDMETQKSFESLNGTNIDVHDIVTQKICLNNKEIFSKSLNGQKVNMHDIETQNEINAQENVIDIHDVETQHDIDIHDMKTPKKIHVKSHNDKTQDNEKLETRIEENGNLIMKKENNIIIQKDEAIASTSYFNDTNKCENKIEYRRSIKKHLQKNSQKCLQSSIATTFENEVSELDTSRNLLGSQCLLEDLIDDDDNDDLLDESKSRSSTPSKTSCVNDDEDVNNKSTDSENIFEAATQINQTDKDTNHRINYSFKASLMDPNDSDETDNECVFQRYSFEENKKNEKSSIIRVSESDDSFTDEEGRFIEMAAIEKRAASNSFEKQNKNKEIRNDSSKDSEDLFNMLTQPINKKNKNLLPKCDEKTQTTVDEVEIDFDTPTQVIDKKNNSEINKDIEIKEKIKNTEVEQVDDFTPTQVLSTLKSSSKEINSLASIKNKIIPDDENITEMEDNTPTQIINIIEKTSNIDNNKYSNSLNSVRLNTIEEFSIENIDYETAATQPINDTEMQKSVLVINKSKNILNLSEKSNNINLDDTIERNLNAMFEDVNEGHNEEQQQISTQLLKNMLETSHCENKSPINNLNINDNSIDCNIEKSIKNSKTIDPSSNLESNKKLLKSNLKNIDNIPEDLSMPRSSPKKNHEESKIVNTIQEIQEENKKKECIFKENKADSENIGNQVLNISIDSNQLQQTSKVLENNDDDILAGLPEVKIAGTYPTSPTSSTSSEYRININHNRTKQISIKIAPKKRRSSRKTFNHKNMQNTELDHTINKSNSTTILKNFSNSFSSNFNDDRVSVEETNKKKKNKKTKESIEKTNPENLYKPRKESNTSSKSVAFINSQEKARESPFISNRRTRNSSKENIDHLSIFQVEKEALVKKVADESAEKNLPNTCVKKRSLNMTDTIEINNSKEHKNNIKENEFINTRSRKINKVTRRRQSANTPDISSLKNSSIACNRKLSDEDISLDKQPIIKIQKLSVYTPTESISSTPTGEVIDNKRKNKKSNQHTNIIDDQVVSVENEKTSQNTKTQKIKFQIDEISSQIGEESQEIEMIMNNALKEQSTETKKDIDNNATNIKTRNNKKHKNIHINADNTESSSTSSIIYESDNANFEIPTSKIKHMKMSKNRSNITNILKNESVKEMKRKNKQSTKSTRVRRQSIIDSSTDENKKIINKSIEIKRNSKQSIKLIQTHQQPIVDSSTDENTKIVNEHIETKKKNKKSTRSTRTHEQLIMDSSMETNQTMLISNTDKINNLRNKRQRQTTEKIESNKKKKMDFIEETNSETNSSIEVTNSSLISTPNRTRRSMNSSFATSSPFKIKHKVLFTGISSNDYSKLLTKLGASQVEDPTKCTVLVTDKIRRTVKFLCALALSIPIVSTNWLHDSEKIGHFEELENYILEDPEAEAKFHFKLKKSLEKAKKYKLLEGYTLILTPNIAPPPPELKSIIISCGGKALLRPPSSWPEKGMIISNKEDLTNAKKFLAKAPKNITIQSTEFILTGILRQELEFNEFRLYN